MTPIKICFNHVKLNQLNESHLNPLSAVLWGQKNPTIQASQQEIISKNFLITDDIRSADFCVLPLMWNYYVDFNRITEAASFYHEALAAQKPFIVFSTGDLTAHIPFSSVSIFQSSAYRSRNGHLNQQLYVIPPFISDYLKIYRDGSYLFREWNEKPVIGFCGQAFGNPLDYLRRNTRIWLNKIGYNAGIKKWEPPPIEPSFYRNKILTGIQRDQKVSPNFVLRQSYRAGYTPKGRKDPFHPTRIEFINNILNSDYTVCMRGAGNFSVRLYETLSLGRIPVYIDSDSPLPFEEWINYRDFFVYMEEREIPFAAEKIYNFHHSLNPQKFLDLQVACRELWEKYLSHYGYLNHLQELLKRPKTPYDKTN